MKHLRLAPLLLLTLACLFFTPSSQAQNPDSLQARLDSLHEVKSDLQLKLAHVETGILDIERVLARIEFESLSEEGIEIEMREAAMLRPSPKPSNELGTIPAGVTVKAVGYTNGYWHVHYKGQTGYVSEVWVLATAQTRGFVEALKGVDVSLDQAQPLAQPPRAQPPPRSTTRSRPCCKICRTGKACGDSCIARNKTCRKGPGCACNG